MHYLKDSLSPSLGTIFFVPSPGIASLLWAALILQPRNAVFVVLGIYIALGIGRALKISDTPELGGGIKANALLACLAAAWLTEHADLSLPAQIGLAVVAAAVATMIAAAIMRVLRNTELPSLVWAYCLVAAVLFVITPDWTRLSTNAMEPWPELSGPREFGLILARSMGSLIYSPAVESGLLVGLAVLLWSRTMFITGLVGWLSGSMLALAFKSLGIGFFWQPTSYNFFLAGMGLGSVFFLPGRASLLIAAASGAGAAFIALGLQHLLPQSTTAYLPISAALTIWVGISALALAKGNAIAWPNRSPQLPPEHAWWRTAHWTRRFGFAEPLLAVPVGGEVLIAQGFGGSLSHIGRWRHALDFQRPTQDGRGYPSPSIWGAAVTAPADGVVDRIVGDIPDNSLGLSNFAENWGNYVVIRMDQGSWTTLAHLQQGSIAVVSGMSVKTGAFVGRVGNSGRSPVPHLHLQVQSGPDPGSPTQPFRLANMACLEPGRVASPHWYAAAVPPEKAVVSAGVSNPAIHRALASIAPGSAVWVIDVDGKLPPGLRRVGAHRTFTARITLDEQGRHVFTIDGGGKLVAALAPDAWRVIELERGAAPFLRFFAYGAPSIPYAATESMRWEDPVPAMPTGWFGRAAAPYRREPFEIAACSCSSVPGKKGGAFTVHAELAGRVGHVPSAIWCEFDAIRGPIQLQADFDEGSINYSLLSFEPELPTERLAASRRDNR